MFLHLCYGTGEVVSPYVNVRKAVREQEDDFRTESFYVTTAGVCYVTTSLFSSIAFDLCCLCLTEAPLGSAYSVMAN